ncbi:MAG: hypothetical protein EOP04_16270 [Proteobacteria bacterium]|nr:MAG: hypothetical protein EOP04_16270 [Pseudomonadota bacterium]
MLKPPFRIVAECYADTLMVSSILNSLKVEHAFGIPEVAKVMAKAKKEEHIIGVVDNDKEKRIPPYLLNFRTKYINNRVILKDNLPANQFLLVLDKAVESFILWNVEQVNLDISQYGFPLVPKLLGRRLKYEYIDTDADFQLVLAELKNRQAPGFITLENILNDFLTP